MNANASGLDKHSLVNAHAVNNEDRGVLTNENVLSKPTVVVMVSIVFNKTVNAETCAEVGEIGIAFAIIAFAAKKNGGNNLVANLAGVALSINGNAFADSYNFTGSFVSKNNFLVAERVITIFVNVSSADTATLNLNENFAGTGSGDFNVAKLYDCFTFNAIYNLRLNKISHF